MHFFVCVACNCNEVEYLYISVGADNCSTVMNFISEGKLCFTETKRLCRITLMIERLGELELGNIVVGIKMLLLKEETKI